MSAAAALTQKRAILYDRVSTTMQAEAGYSGGDDGFQLERCQAWADANGATVVDTITDVASGAKWDIAGLMDAVARADRGEYDLLVVSDTSRFARSLAKKMVYEAELRQRGVTVIYTNLPDSIAAPKTFDERLTANVMGSLYGALDEYDREKRAWWTANGRRQKAKRGRVVGTGPAPYGYVYASEWVEERKREIPYALKPDPDTARIVQQIFLAITRRSADAVARQLNAEGIPSPGRWTPSAKRPLRGRWTSSTIRKIVHNPVYRGLWRFGDEPLEAPPLVDESAWRLAQEGLAHRQQARRGRMDEQADAWLLRGALTCGLCDGLLSTNSVPLAGWRDGRQRQYACARTFRHAVERGGWEPCSLKRLIAADEYEGPEGRRGRSPLLGIESYAWQMVIWLVMTPGLFESQLTEALTATADERNEVAGRLATFDREIAAQERRMRRAEEEKVKLDADDPRYGMQAEIGLRASRAVTGLRAERSAYVAALERPVHDEDFEALRRDVEGARVVIALALETGAREAPADLRREVFAALRLRGRVWPAAEDDEAAVQLGRAGRFVVEWELLRSGHSFLKLSLLHTSDGPVLRLAPPSHAPVGALPPAVAARTPRAACRP